MADDKKVATVDYAQEAENLRLDIGRNENPPSIKGPGGPGGGSSESREEHTYRMNHEATAATVSENAAKLVEMAKEPEFKKRGIKEFLHDPLSDQIDNWSAAAKYAVAHLDANDKTKGQLYKQIIDSNDHLVKAYNDINFNQNIDAGKRELAEAVKEVNKVTDTIGIMEQYNGRLSEGGYKKWLDTPIVPAKEKDKNTDNVAVKSQDVDWSQLGNVQLAMAGAKPEQKEIKQAGKDSLR